MWDEGDELEDWDGVVLQNALQIVRCDPTRATGFAPAELMIGRPLVYPIQFSRQDIDMSGTTLTTPLVKKLQSIRENTFRKATKKIKKRQKQYTQQYNKRMNAKPFVIKVGDKVQYYRYKSKNTLSKNELTLWCPAGGYHLVLAVDFEKKRVILQDASGKLLAKTHPFDRIRKFKGKSI